MVKSFYLSTFFILISSLAAAAPPVAGGVTLGASVSVVQQLAYGWSAKRAVLDKAVYNDQNEKVGKVEDLIITPGQSVSYAIVSTGGFLGMAKHDVAIPADQFRKGSDNKILLPGATKQALKALPEFEYAPKAR